MLSDTYKVETVAGGAHPTSSTSNNLSKYVECELSGSLFSISKASVLGVLAASLHKRKEHTFLMAETVFRTLETARSNSPTSKTLLRFLEAGTYSLRICDFTPNVARVGNGSIYAKETYNLNGPLLRAVSWSLHLESVHRSKASACELFTQ